MVSGEHMRGFTKAGKPVVVYWSDHGDRLPARDQQGNYYECWTTIFYDDAGRTTVCQVDKLFVETDRLARARVTREVLEKWGLDVATLEYVGDRRVYRLYG